MRTHTLFYFFLAFSLASCGKMGDKTPALTRQLNLSFDSTIIDDSSFLIFRVDEDPGTSVEFSKGIQQNDKYSISHAAYAVNPGPVYINLYTKGKGPHWFRMTLDSSSPSLNPQFVKDSIMDIKNFGVDETGWWWLYVVIALLLLLLVLYWIYHRRNSFESGYLHITHPGSNQKSLVGKRKVFLGKELKAKKNACVLFCEVDVLQKGSKNERRRRPLLRSDVFLNIIVNDEPIDGNEVILQDDDAVIVRSEDQQGIFLQFTFKNI